jgi:hypothetical protein
MVESSYRKDGGNKRVYQNIGSVIQEESGLFMLLAPSTGYAVFSRQYDGKMPIISLFKPEEKGEPF